MLFLFKIFTFYIEIKLIIVEQLSKSKDYFIPYNILCTKQ